MTSVAHAMMATSGNLYQTRYDAQRENKGAA